MSWHVRSVMTTRVVTVAPMAGYKEIARRMYEHRVSAMPVVDPDGRVEGVVSQADLLLKEERLAWGVGPRRIVARADEVRATARDAAAMMSSPAITIGPHATLTQAARIMHQQRVKRLPVVDEEGRLVGMVSRGDLLRPFLRSDESIAHEVREDVLRRSLAMDPETVQLEVEDGIVRLAGTLETRSMAVIASRLVEHVEGVVGIDDQLSWTRDDRRIEVEPPMAARLSADER